MKSRFLYMKFLGLLLVLVGFSYSITSFSIFFAYIFDYQIFEENLNGYIMSIGLIIPLFVFIYGIYFYFYTDFNITKISKVLIIINLFLLVISGIMIVLNTMNNLFSNIIIFQIFEFIHESFAYCLVVLSLMGIIGCFKYKY